MLLTRRRRENEQSEAKFLLLYLGQIWQFWGWYLVRPIALFFFFHNRNFIWMDDNMSKKTTHKKSSHRHTIYLDNGIRGRGGDTTVVVAVAAHVDVASLAPVSAPAVLDNVEIVSSEDSVANAETDSEDTMVEARLRAKQVVVNARPFFEFLLEL